MRNTNLPASALLGLLLVAGPHATGADAAPLLPEAERACRSAIESSLRRWVGQTVRLRQRCLSDVVTGAADPATDCLAIGGEDRLGSRLAKANQRLGRALSRSCAGADFGLLSYPGPCAEGGGAFSVESLSSCVRDLGHDAVVRLFGAWYPASLEFTRPPAGTCLREAPRQAFSMLIGDLGLRLGCLLDQEAGLVDPSIDCRAALIPSGTGTGDPRLDDALGRAHLAWLGAVPQSCALTDLEALGFGANCDDGGDGTLDIRDLKRCVYEANNLRSFALVDLVFPSDPVCGNGILQEGEACDEGIDNSDTAPDACREDCTLPSCGDGATDPSNDEECDDGNFTNLDGCTASCEAEFCGDGVDNNGNAEQCDDGNAVATDACTNECRAATCGDGIVCTAPGCTSGPSGGVEQCDAGSQNAADGACRPDCSGYRRTCTLSFGVTSSATLGALTWEVAYGSAAGDFLGTGAAVKCTSKVTGGLFSFFDNETKKTVKESIILVTGFATPTTVAECTFATNEATPVPASFPITISSASTPDFVDVPATMAVTGIDCSFQ